MDLVQQHEKVWKLLSELQKKIVPLKEEVQILEEKILGLEKLEKELSDLLLLQMEVEEKIAKIFPAPLPETIPEPVPEPPTPPPVEIPLAPQTHTTTTVAEAARQFLREHRTGHWSVTQITNHLRKARPDLVDGKAFRQLDSNVRMALKSSCKSPKSGFEELTVGGMVRYRYRGA